MMKLILSFWLPFLLVINIFCTNSNGDNDCSVLVQDFELKSDQCVISLPHFQIADSVPYTGFDKTLVSSYQLNAIALPQDSLVVYISVHNYDSPETNSFLDFDYIKDKKTREIEYLLKEKNIIYDTTLSIQSEQIGYLKYLIDPAKTNYIDKSKTKYYDSKIFFFKKRRLIEIEIIEKYRGAKNDRFSITDCIVKNLKI